MVVSLLPLLAVTSGAAGASDDYQLALDLTFPVAGPATFADEYHANRGGGVRRHEATDLYAPKLSTVHAVRDGRICFMSGLDSPVPVYGYYLTLCGDDGLEYHYVHLNDDSPGTDDGRGGRRHAYAEGLRPGSTVRRGQTLGYLGDSGNAEATPPHLHFEIEDPRLDDARVASSPYRGNRRNPFPSLRAARDRGDLAGRLLRQGDRGADVLGWQGQLVAAGASLPTTGFFGPLTAEATTAFQLRAGLATGAVGPRTRTAMTAALRGPGGSGGGAPGGSTEAPGWPGRLLRLVDPPLSGADIRTLQARLRDRGWRDPSGPAVAVDGVFGPQTDRLVRQLQRVRGLDADGVVGPLTWRAAWR